MLSNTPIAQENGRTYDRVFDLEGFTNEKSVDEDPPTTVQIKRSAPEPPSNNNNNKENKLYPIILRINFAKNVYRSTFLKNPDVFARIYTVESNPNNPNLKSRTSDSFSYITSSQIVSNDNNPIFNFKTEISSFHLNQCLQLELWNHKYTSASSSSSSSSPDQSNEKINKGFLGGILLTPQQILNFVNNQKIVKLNPLTTLRYPIPDKDKFKNTSLFIQIQTPNRDQLSSANRSTFVDYRRNQKDGVTNKNERYKPQNRLNLKQQRTKEKIRRRTSNIVETIQQEQQQQLNTNNSNNNGTTNLANTVVNVSCTRNIDAMINSNFVDNSNNNDQSRMTPDSMIQSGSTNQVSRDYSQVPVVDHVVENTNNISIQSSPPPSLTPIQSKLPPGWTKMIHDDGRIYYANLQTGDSSWYDPRLRILSNMKIPIPNPDNLCSLDQNWTKITQYASNNRVKYYFINEKLQVTQSTDPRVVIWLDGHFEQKCKEFYEKRERNNNNNNKKLEPVSQNNLNRSHFDRQNFGSAPVPNVMNNITQSINDLKILSEQDQNNHNNNDNNHRYHSNMTLAEQATTQRELAHRRSLARKLEYAKDRIFQRNYVHGLYCRITVSREHLLEHSYRILLHYFWGWRIF